MVSGALNSVWSKYLVKDGAHGWATHSWFRGPAFLVLRSRVPGFAFSRSWFGVPGILGMWARRNANFIQERGTQKNMKAKFAFPSHRTLSVITGLSVSSGCARQPCQTHEKN